VLDWIDTHPAEVAIIVYVCCVVGMLLMALAVCRGGSFYDED
jgi:hypothetical protein